MCIEILAQAIRKNSNIHGLMVDNVEIKQILYADDVTLFLQDRYSVEEVKRLFDVFYQISGLKVNNDKTYVLLLGIPREDCVLPFGRVEQVVKILGIYFSLNPDVKEVMNYKEILSKIKRLLSWWKQRDLTLMGKVQLVKVFVLPKLIYISSLMVTPDWVFEELDKVVFDFIWRGRDKIKRNILYLDYDRGGLKFINFRVFVKAQRIMWIKRLISGDHSMKWKLCFKFFTKSVGGILIFYSKAILGLLRLTLPEFYNDMLQVWMGSRSLILKEDSKRNEVIFDNKAPYLRQSVDIII